MKIWRWNEWYEKIDTPVCLRLRPFVDFATALHKKRTCVDIFKEDKFVNQLWKYGEGVHEYQPSFSIEHSIRWPFKNQRIHVILDHVLQLEQLINKMHQNCPAQPKTSHVYPYQINHKTVIIVSIFNQNQSWLNFTKQKPI